ncbi:molybdate ABC transporter substrate-binding protein [Solicola sp. PLA-1-18]|uniref:molybdate ABC transporter substrate-binding protein n=1 Tax=Solicola sp. PLA-1-18 TaxID=3380532 RepID=UPI003B7FA464
MRPRRLAALASALVLSTALVACGGGDDGTSGSASSDATSTAPTGEITVLAAASLTEAFGELKTTFESQNDGATVNLSFDSSSVLAEQVVQGNPADVLATADEKTMTRVTDADLAAGEPTVFASNTLVIATPKGNPGKIESIQDLGKDGTTFAVCVPAAPCGAASTKLLEVSSVTAKPATEEQNVKGVLTKITQGEVDAGLVYASDAKAAGDDVDVVVPDGADQAVNLDPIVVLKNAENPELAKAWVELVTGSEGQKVLESYGFQPAPAS